MGPEFSGWLVRTSIESQASAGRAEHEGQNMTWWTRQEFQVWGVARGRVVAPILPPMAQRLAHAGTKAG